EVSGKLNPTACPAGDATAERPREGVGIEPLGHSIEPYRGVPEAVVFRPLLLGPEDAVGLVDLLEAFGLLLVAAGDVGMELLGELPVGFLDRSVVGVLGDAERFIKILHWMERVQEFRLAVRSPAERGPIVRGMPLVGWIMS